MSSTHASNGLADRTFDGVIFDRDETLVNSQPAIERAWTTWAMHYKIPREAFANMSGRPADAIVQRILPESLWQEAMDWILELEIHDTDGIEPMPGAARALATLPLDKVAIATSAVEELMLARLHSAGLPTPTVLVSRRLVTRGKPAPDSFLLAAQLLGIDPSRALVVEDAEAGIDAARTAGMASLAVSTTTPRERLRADAVVGTLADVGWDVTPHGIVVALPDGELASHG